MTNSAIRRMQFALGAMALMMAGWASAQAADTAAPAPAPEAAAAKPAPQQHKRQHNRQHRYSSPAAHEAAAAREEARRGRLGNGQSEGQYERNALARCDVFKTELDREACVGRVRSGQTSGSVEGGGTLREYTQQVPVNP